MRKLPHWTLTQKRPSIYDTESATAVEQTAKVYGAMQELIDEYNDFVDKLNAEIEAFETSTNQDIECFKTTMTELQTNFIECIDTKIAKQDKEIADAVSFMKDNLGQYVVQVIDEMKTNGELSEAIMNAFNNMELRVSAIETKLGYVYSPENEELNLMITAGDVAVYNDMLNVYNIDKDNEELEIGGLS